MHEHYRRLGLPPSADINEVRRAYRELARRWRPHGGDQGLHAASPDRLASLHRAYETLTEPDRVSGGVVDTLRPGSGREPAFADEIDIERAEAALKAAEEQIAAAPAAMDLERALASMRKSQARIKVARRRRNRPL